MAMPYEKTEAHILLDRVETRNFIREVVQCSLCDGLLWKSVACKKCETPFCAACIQVHYAAELQPICPHCRSSYTERNTPQANIRLLADLKISCIYKSNGCTEILSYNELEEHEEKCDYQLFICNGCEQGIIKIDFEKHKSECGLILIKCDQCLTSYKRQDEHLHTFNECLRLQLQEQKSKTEQLERKIDQMEQKLKQNDIFWAAFFLTIKETK